MHCSDMVHGLEQMVIPVERDNGGLTSPLLKRVLGTCDICKDDHCAKFRGSWNIGDEHNNRL
jgi:hypothetical protein